MSGRTGVQTVMDRSLFKSLTHYKHFVVLMVRMERNDFTLVYVLVCKTYAQFH